MKRLFYKLYATLFFLSFLASSPTFAMDIVFRIDDYFLNNDTLNYQILKAFEDANIPLSIAVIPCDPNENLICEDSPLTRKIKLLSKQGKVEVVQHGLTHVYSAIGEFDGYGYEEQLRRISKGKLLLDSIFEQNTIGFIPPRNAYNKATLTALQDLKFTYLSNDTWGVGCTDIEFFPDNYSLRYYPESVDKVSKHWEIPTLLQTLYKVSHKDGLIITMMHPFDITPNYTVDELRADLQEIASIPNLHCYTFSGLPKKWSRKATFINANGIERNIVSKHFYHPIVLWSTKTIIWACILDTLSFMLLDVLLNLLTMIVVYYMLSWFLMKLYHRTTFSWCLPTYVRRTLLVAALLIGLLAGLWTWIRLFDVGWLTFLAIVMICSAIIMSVITVLGYKKYCR